ncbi:MAG TPA: HD domain-containing protein [Tepidisphaeraceae bacterium]|jgi:exopolyphosphatase/guanosine-5'-triphosphate,3'-diphosphate pyrophosphatase
MSRPGTESRTTSKLACSKLAWFRDWAFDQLGDIRHERRVAAHVSSLINITFPLHDLTRADIRLVKIAAFIHDVGRSINKRKHPALGARMVRQATNLPLTKKQRRALAYLTLRHRGLVPPAQDDPALSRVKDPVALQLLLGILRAADTLDSRRLPSPRLTFSRRGRRIRIVCRLREESAEARRIFSRRKKFRLLEEMLDCRIEVVVVTQRRLSAVA